MDQLKKIASNIKEFWGKLSSNTKKLIIFGCVFSVLLAVILTLFLNNTEYVVLYEDLESGEAAEILQIIQESGVEYKYETDGTVLIPVEQENKLRMQLAQSGYPKTGLNYDVFTQNIDFMTTDYEKRQYEIFQLQERLQESIKTIDAVETVIVTISMPEDEGYAWETKTVESSASVKINLKNGKSLSESQTDGILQLISKSVKGLKEENIAIIDTDGHSLIASGELQQTNAIKLEMDIEKEFELETEKNVSNLLYNIYGVDNVRVSVSCDINFDKKIGELLQYIPEGDSNKGVISQSDINREGTGEGKIVGGVAGTEGNAEVPTYPGVTIDGDDVYFKDSDSIKYLVSELKEQIQYTPGKIDKLTVAVVVNKKDMDDEEIAKTKELVAFSAGITSENVSLHNMEFYEEDSEGNIIPELPIDEKTGEIALSKELLILIGIGVGVFIILMVIIMIIVGKKKKQKRQASVMENLDITQEVVSEATMQEMFDELALKNKEHKTLEQIKEFTVNNPEIVSSLLKTWLREGR